MRQKLVPWAAPECWNVEHSPNLSLPKEKPGSSECSHARINWYLCFSTHQTSRVCQVPPALWGRQVSSPFFGYPQIIESFWHMVQSFPFLPRENLGAEGFLPIVWCCMADVNLMKGCLEFFYLLWCDRFQACLGGAGVTQLVLRFHTKGNFTKGNTWTQISPCIVVELVCPWGKASLRFTTPTPYWLTTIFFCFDLCFMLENSSEVW